MTILFVSVGVFMVFPVTFPRDLFPVVGDGFSDHAMNFLRTYMDAPANCLPSTPINPAAAASAI